MSKRAVAREETRARIIEATARLHGERGVFGTSWKDIAAEADVAVATVYGHFPSLDELLPACGAHVLARIRPPRAEDAADLVGDNGTTTERLGRAARALFDFYERGGPHIDVDIRERELPGMREWEQHLRDTVAAFAAKALQPERPGASTLRSVAALLDLSTYKSFEARGVKPRAAARAVARAAISLIEEEQ